MDGDLLHVIKEEKSLPEGEETPVVYVEEFRVNAQTAPYLVSTSKGLLWIARPHRDQKVRAVVRIKSPPLGQVFREVVLAVEEQARELQWGSVHPHTPEGLQDAIDHIRYYGVSEVEVLSSDPEIEVEGAKVVQADWVPDDMWVVVPKDRMYVGMARILGDEGVSLICHNPSRGIAVCKNG